MKRFLRFLTVLLLIVGVSASPQMLVDNAELLGEMEAIKLEDRLCQIADRWRIDVVIVTVNDLDGSAAGDYAEDFYRDNDYGDDGVLLLVSMQEREFWIASFGACTGMEDEISDSFVDSLSDGDYYDAFTDFADQCDAAMEDFEEEGNGSPVTPILICLGIGAAVGLIVTGIMASQLKSVRPRYSAGDYVVSDSLHLTHCHDLFLYRNVRRTPKPKSNGSSGRSSGRGGKF